MEEKKKALFKLRAKTIKEEFERILPKFVNHNPRHFSKTIKNLKILIGLCDDIYADPMRIARADTTIDGGLDICQYFSQYNRINPGMRCLLDDLRLAGNSTN